MREHEHYEYEFDDERVQEDNAHEPSYFDEYAEPHAFGNEMARSAVERFLESETGDAGEGIDGLNSSSKRSLHAEMTEPDDAYHSSSVLEHNTEEEYMTRLADARRERQRRREQNPVPKPAVRVNVERPRRSHPVVIDKPPADEDWGPLAEEDFDNFRKRYSEPHVMAPRDIKASDRTRNTVATRRNSDVSHEGPNPLRYMLFIVLFGLLVLMVIIAGNNRSLRLDVARLEASATDANEYALQVIWLELELESYQSRYASQAEALDAMTAQLNELGYGVGYEYLYTPDSPPEGTTGRPTDEAGTNGNEDDATLPTPSQPAAPILHTVESGQFLSRIAVLHFGSSAQRYIDLIVNANDISDPDDIYIGQVLVIPVLE